MVRGGAATPLQGLLRCPPPLRTVLTLALVVLLVGHLAVVHLHYAAAGTLRGKAMQLQRRQAEVTAAVEGLGVSVAEAATTLKLAWGPAAPGGAPVVDVAQAQAALTAALAEHRHDNLAMLRDRMEHTAAWLATMVQDPEVLQCVRRFKPKK